MDSYFTWRMQVEQMQAMGFLIAIVLMFAIVLMALIYESFKNWKTKNWDLLIRRSKYEDRYATHIPYEGNPGFQVLLKWSSEDIHRGDRWRFYKLLREATWYERLRAGK